MKKYYVNENEQSNGDHEIHVPGCQYFPSYYEYLGEFDNCKDATEKAKNIGYRNANGCYYCNRDCHVS